MDVPIYLSFLCNFLLSKIKRLNYQDLCILTCKKGRSSTSVSGAGYNRYRSNSLFLSMPIRKWFLCKTLDQLFIFSTTSSIFVSLKSFASSWQVASKVVMVMEFTISGQLLHFQSLCIWGVVLTSKHQKYMTYMFSQKNKSRVFFNRSLIVKKL